MNKTSFVIVAILAFLLGLVCYSLFHKCDVKRDVEYKYIKSIDTVYILQEPLVIEKAAPRIVYREKIDTLIHYEFTAVLDTIIRNDTVRLYYYYPQHLLDLYVTKEPARVITIETEIIKKRPVWLDVLSHTGAAGMGYLLSNSKKK